MGIRARDGLRNGSKVAAHRGNTELNALLWMPPTGQRAGDILMVDSTNFTTLFGGTDSLVSFWRNFSLMK